MTEMSMEILIGRLQKDRAFRRNFVLRREPAAAVVARRREPNADAAARKEKEAGRGSAYAFLAGALLVLIGETLGIAHGLAAIFGR